MHEQSSTAEEWRPVLGWEGRYEVSSQGRVRSLLWKVPRVLSAFHDADGYRRVHLHGGPNGNKLRTVASVVAEAWHGRRPDEMVTRHLNGSRTDDIPSNLAWGTVAENTDDKVRHGTDQRGERHPNASMTDAVAAEILRRSREGEARRSLADEYGVTLNTVNILCRRVSWRHLE